jgi:hypothetical protein
VATPRELYVKYPYVDIHKYRTNPMNFTTIPKNKRPSTKVRKPSAAVRQHFNIPLGTALDVVDRYQIGMCADLARDTRATRYDRRRPS